MKKQYQPNDVIHFQLDNDPSCSGVGTFVSYSSENCITVQLLTNVKKGEHPANSNLLVFLDEINN